MAFDIDDLIRVRPFLFHLTDRRNLDRIRRLQRLQSASEIMRRANREDLLRSKRSIHVTVQMASEIVFLRDQRPLYAGNMKLSNRWTFAKFIETLNNRIFFWPGTSDGPIDYGVRHFNRYRDELPVL